MGKDDLTFDKILEVFIKYEDKVNSKDIINSQISYINFIMDSLNFFTDFCMTIKSENEVIPNAEKLLEFVNYSYMKLYSSTDLKQIESEIKMLNDYSTEELFNMVRDCTLEHIEKVNKI